MTRDESTTLSDIHINWNTIPW